MIKKLREGKIQEKSRQAEVKTKKPRRICCGGITRVPSQFESNSLYADPNLHVSLGGGERLVIRPPKPV